MPVATSSPVEEIKSRLDIVDVIQEYIQMKQAGTNWKANCPFHREKTPSFMASRDKQIWHCFGCGEGGDVFTFVKKMEGMEFPEVLRHLAKKANITLPSFNPEQQNQKTRLLDVVKAAAEYYRAVFASEEGKPARDYLEQRGVSKDTIEKFDIGFAPEKWDGVNTFLVQKKFTPQEIFDAGMTIRRERGSGYYDRFRGRIIFPLRDVHGSVIGFGGRILAGDDQAAKYINSPQTALYDKSGFLYGLDLAKNAIRENKLAVLVEGYMDVIASHQAGVAHAVASSGTALTDKQVRLLKRYTNSIALAFDADLAGSDAAMRGIDVALRAELEVRMITLPDAKDPDELIRKNPAAWPEALNKATTIMEYTFEKATKGKDMQNISHKKEIVKTILTAIAKLPDQIEQVHYIQKLATLVHVEEEILRSKLVQFRTKNKPGYKEERDAAKVPQDRLNTLSERLLAFFFMQPSYIDQFGVDLPPEAFGEGEGGKLYKALKLAYTANNPFSRDESIKTITGGDPQASDFVSMLVMRAEHEREELGEDALEKDVAASAHLLRKEFYTREVQRIARLIAEAEQTHDEPALARYTEQHQAAVEKLVTLS